MFKLLWQRLQCWFRLRWLTKAQRLSIRWMADSEKVAKRLSAQHEQLQELRQALELRVSSLEVDLKAARELQQRHETALESLRSENTVLGVEITALTAANQLALERYRAETAIEAMRQASAVGRREER